MTVVRKFLFDNDFGDPTPGAQPQSSVTPAAPARPPVKKPAPTFTEEELQAANEKARRQGEETGLSKGRTEAVAAFDKQVATALANISAQAANLAKAAEAQAVAAARSVDLAIAIVRKLHPALAAQNGLAEVETALARCLDQLKQEPRLVAYVNAGLLDALQERLSKLTSSAGFEGRVVLIAEDSLGASDCRIEWADGGVERDAGRTWKAIEEALERCLATDQGRDA